MSADPERFRILNAEPLGYSPRARSILEQVGQVVEAPLSRAELLDRVGEFDVLIVRLAHRVDHELLDAAPRLRAVVSATTGLDHVDVDLAESRGIEVLSLRGETDFLKRVVATAEHTWALLLALVRRVPEAARSVRAGEWDRDRFRGRELSGKRLGVLGLGRIGSQIAAYGRAFGMTVRAYDPFLSPWPSGLEAAHSLEALLENSDVLSVHVPLSDATSGMLDGPALARLPRGALLVNTSRGGIVDERALVAALERGHLAGAALDVVEHEREPDVRLSGPVLRYLEAHENLLVTPHIGGATYESMERTEIFMARKLVAFLEGQRAGGHDHQAG